MEGINQKDLQEVLAYIASYWKKIIIHPSKYELGETIRQVVRLKLPKKDSNPSVISVPYTCIVPNDAKFKYIFLLGQLLYVCWHKRHNI
jgi:hypothetical protein